MGLDAVVGHSATGFPLRPNGMITSHALPPQPLEQTQLPSTPHSPLFEHKPATNVFGWTPEGQTL